MIRSHLFSQGHPLKAERGLRDALEGHKHDVLIKIKGISDLDQMTNPFLERLVKESLIQPVAIQFDKMTKKIRTEDGRQVARLSIPFTGDSNLPKFSPSSAGTTLVRGEISGHTIQFDVILSGQDDQSVKNEIRSNLDLMRKCADGVNQQVKEFNESLPATVNATFTAKLDELTKQHAMLDDIPDEPEPRAMTPISPAVAPPKKGKARAVQVIQYVENQYVQQLNQTNYNVGDVNNAIQST